MTRSYRYVLIVMSVFAVHANAGDNGVAVGTCA